jgi:hypothetical protein
MKVSDCVSVDGGRGGAFVLTHSSKESAQTGFVYEQCEGGVPQAPWGLVGLAGPWRELWRFEAWAFECKCSRG